jgi:nucleotide sugar dehydrogenase
MSRVAVIGTGYVGTVTATCFAWLGHDVVGIDVDVSRVEQLAAGQVPLFEPGLAELLTEATGTGRLTFSVDMSDIAGAQVVFLCVGTPPGVGGAPDLSQVESAAHAIAANMSDGTVLVNKSTVPVGSGNWVRTVIEEALPRTGGPKFSVVSNPEFLREGCAIEDFLYPDRIVLGGENGSPKKVAELYAAVLAQSFPGGRPERQPQLIVTDLPSAEMVKYAANAFLATKISFANEVAAICELVGADARQVLPAIGSDERIGSRFLQQGLGWGGSCFGKDLAALIATAVDYGYSAPLLRATTDVNQAQRASVIRKLQTALKVLKGRRIAILGLAFKPGTDDLRDAPALDIIRRLRSAGVIVSAYDPVVKQLHDGEALGVRMAADAYDAADRADAVVLVTEWDDFANLDLDSLKRSMAGDLVLDGRGAIDPVAAEEAGLRVTGFGW